MNSKLLFFLISYIIGSVSCTENSIIDEEPINSDTSSTKASLVWYNSSQFDFHDVGAFIGTNYVVYSKWNFNNNFIDELHAFNKTTGDSGWYWNENAMVTHEHLMVNDILFFVSQANGHTYAIDLNNGHTKWKFLPFSSKASSVEGLSYIMGRLYVSYTFGDRKSLNDSCIIFSIDPLSGTEVSEFKIYTKNRDNYQPGIWKPVSWIHPNGDTILVCQSRSWCWDPNVNEGRGEFFAINLSEDEFYFDFKDFFGTDDVGGTPIIKDDILYISSGWEENAAIDLITKEVIWRTEIPEEKRTGNKDFILIDDNLVFNSGNRGIMNFVNANTGELIKSLDNVGKSSYTGSRLLVHKGFIYFNTAKGFFKVSKNGMVDRHITLQDINIGENGNFGNGLAVDPATGYFYAAANGKYFTCFKLND